MPRASLLLAAAALLAACSPTVATRGNMVPDQRLAQVTVGTSTKDDVIAALGTPTTVATFDPNTWYYIGQRTEQVAFLEPEVLDRKVVALTFDTNGVVQSMNRLGLDNGYPVQPVERETPTTGRRLTFFEQLLGNIGRYNNNAAGAGVRLPGTTGG